MHFTNILVPFDTSEHAQRALTLAKGLVEEDPTTQLHVIGVFSVSEFPPPVGLDGNPYEVLPEPLLDPQTYFQLVEESKKRIMGTLEKATQPLLTDITNKVTLMAIDNRSVVDAITTYAHDKHCDLIIMGSRGLGVLRGMLGSVSYGVLRSAQIPVMVVKDDA